LLYSAKSSDSTITVQWPVFTDCAAEAPDVPVTVLHEIEARNREGREKTHLKGGLNEGYPVLLQCLHKAAVARP
jgi:hypothetical protein